MLEKNRDFVVAINGRLIRILNRIARIPALVDGVIVGASDEFHRFLLRFAQLSGGQITLLASSIKFIPAFAGTSPLRSRGQVHCVGGELSPRRRGKAWFQSIDRTPVSNHVDSLHLEIS